MGPTIQEMGAYCSAYLLLDCICLCDALLGPVCHVLSSRHMLAHALSIKCPAVVRADHTLLTIVCLHPACTLRAFLR